ncbi:TetR/AcrR family transcriptional regulator [Mycobacterium branderi]|uniref:TetR family transcriptional regulator n=1 Tax=Mycobacterium branderi TaxID=43348 RepID=A0A7I7W1B3_9MYCO|nr:TetR/AcrR family transcriptional regulator [Mycobacterium branderi]MCV7235022.1 TetR/AcrR family transcriptional regulator [Mycobacterium branderi]ORA36696.1 TetR family transcriptional regulator [Mycobacterium branderi]BBZ11346.1 putative TetR-family transcriptional regulator [Mycobacterium branderi]
MPASSSYHHGDLPAALVRAAIDLLEESGAAELSLREVARRAGVSPSAPYRHFAGRDELLSAVAAVGYRELGEALVKAHPAPSSADDFADIAVAYVQFALTRPGLFQVMFGEPCDPNAPDRAAAVEAIHEYLKSIVGQAFPAADADAMSTASWALVHGLAFLHLDGKLDASSKRAVSNRVRTAVRAMLQTPVNAAAPKRRARRASHR